MHGPLELLLTVSEEQGLDGAKALDPKLVTGRLLVNLDGTSDGSITVGCAGSAHTFTRLPLSPRPCRKAGPRCRSSYRAKGGHSGEDIARGRANAITALAGCSRPPERAAPSRRLDGGVSRNAIPRDARAVVAVPAADEGPSGPRGRALDALREQHAGTDDGLELSLEPYGSARGP